MSLDPWSATKTKLLLLSNTTNDGFTPVAKGDPETADSAPALETLNADTLFDPKFVARRKVPEGLIASATGVVPAGKGEPLTSVDRDPPESEKTRTVFPAGLVTYRKRSWGSTSMKLGFDPTVVVVPTGSVPSALMASVVMVPAAGLET